MIYLHKYDRIITNPAEEIKEVEVKNYLYENLEKGLVVFLIPEDILNFGKNIKKNYKVGFLYDILTLTYPSKGKEDKHKIISEKYHLWFTYRQFHNVLDEYSESRAKYILKRSLLEKS